MDKRLNLLYILVLSALIFMQKWSITEGNDSKDEDECPCFVDLYQPICASNNVTYPNSCYLKCAQKKDPSIKGLCYGGCSCDDDNQPGTGWGWGPWRSVPNFWRIPGKTRIVPSYTTNIVGKNSEKNSGASAGVVVVEEIDGCLCAKIYKPVCASNNVTYGNECVFKCQQEKESYLTQSCAGECPCPESKYFRLEN